MHEHVLGYLENEDERAQNLVRFAPLRRERLGRSRFLRAPKATVEVATPENFAPLGTLANVRLGLTSDKIEILRIQLRLGKAADLGYSPERLLGPPARPGGRPRNWPMPKMLNAVFYLLRSGCQWS